MSRIYHLQAPGKPIQPEASHPQYYRHFWKKIEWFYTNLRELGDVVDKLYKIRHAHSAQNESDAGIFDKPMCFIKQRWNILNLILDYHVKSLAAMK